MPTQTPHPTQLARTARTLAFVCVVCCLAFFSACGNKTQQPPPCTQDSECPSGQVCNASQCKSVQNQCLDDSDCPTLSICVDNKCRTGSCESGSDCPADRICQQQRCVRPSKTETNTPDGGGQEQNNPDAGTPETPQNESPSTEQPADKAQPQICEPNQDGTIARSELLFRSKGSVIYSEAGSAQSTVTVDLKGTTDAKGVTTWDFSKDFPGQRRIIEEILPVTGTWFADAFKGATYASILDRSLDALGVYKVTDDALLMQGWVSQKPNQIKITYGTPIALLKFPLSVGTKWKVESSSSGTFNLAAYSASEIYEFEADATGKLKTPNGTYSVVRLKLNFTQQQLLPTPWRRTRISYFFVAECFGIVTRIDSKLYETSDLFTEAELIKRLSD